MIPKDPAQPAMPNLSARPLRYLEMALTAYRRVLGWADAETRVPTVRRLRTIGTRFGMILSARYDERCISDSDLRLRAVATANAGRAARMTYMRSRTAA